jgi:hypothetical protein
MSKSIPKASEAKPKPYRSMKGTMRQSETPYTIRLLDEGARGNQIPLSGWKLWENVKAKVPTPALAWCLPNEFEAEYLDLVLRYKVEIVKGNKNSKWGITSLFVTPKKAGGSIDDIKLPMPTFLKESINLATLRCVIYPANYEGNSLRIAGAIIKTDDKPVPELVGWESSTPSSIMRDFVGGGSGRKQDSEERLAIVSKAFMKAKWGEKEKRVKEALEREEGGVGDETVKRLIKKCKDLGLIPRNDRSKK